MSLIINNNYIEIHNTFILIPFNYRGIKIVRSIFIDFNIVVIQNKTAIYYTVRVLVSFYTTYMTQHVVNHVLYPLNRFIIFVSIF